MSAATDTALNAVLDYIDEDDVAAVLDHVTQDGGLLDWLEALDDGEGELAAELAEWIEEDPESALDALLTDDFGEALAEAAESSYEDAPDEATQQYEAALDALHEQAEQDHVRLDETSFAPYVLAADGDLEKAYAEYRRVFRDPDASPELGDAFLAVADGDEELAADGHLRDRRLEALMGI